MKKKTKINRNFWKREEEIIVKNWADKAQCYQWMHSRCREIYQKRNAWFSIPVIIISTITGTANFAQDRFPEDYKQYMVMAIGSLSIIAGIITTIYQFLKISELNEGHRVAAVSWGKFHNNLKTLVLRHPLDRLSPNHAIKIYQDEYDHLIEISPVILKSVLKLFNSNFKKNTELIKPEICSKLNTTEIFNMTEKERIAMVNEMNNVKPNKKLMNTFFDINGRNPSETEMELMEKNNLTSSVGVAEQTDDEDFNMFNSAELELGGVDGDDGDDGDEDNFDETEDVNNDGIDEDDGDNDDDNMNNIQMSVDETSFLTTSDV